MSAASRLTRRMTIAGVRDDGADRGRGNRRRRADDRAQQTVEAPLRRKLAPPRRVEAGVHAAPTQLQRLERRDRRQLAAADREAQAITRHRVHEAAGVAREDYPVDRY